MIVEGIHGLNPELVPSLPPEAVYRIYVSAITQLNLDRHNRVSILGRRNTRDFTNASATKRRSVSAGSGARETR